MAAYTTNPYVEAVADELDLFSTPPTFTGVEKFYYVNYRPTSQITTDTSPVEFNISNQGIDYIDLQRTKLYVRAKITKSDGKSLVEDEQVAPVNLWLHSLWSQVDLTLNGKLVTSSSNLYPYKSYHKRILNASNDTKQSSLQAQLYYKDDGDSDETNPIAGINSGLVHRNTYSKMSKSVDMQGSLCEDFMDINRYLLNGVSLQLKLYPTRQKFNLMSGQTGLDYKVVLQDVYLTVCKGRPSMNIITRHARMLGETTAKYPFTNKVVVCLVSAEAANGNYTKKPFNFAMYDVNGESLPSQPLSLSSGQIVTAYERLFEGREHLGSDITRYNFSMGSRWNQNT
ncbi:uncharacterized protein LOC124152541 [Haliotis rufescens]|uniref:uncharacterized protein LOC124152541 n=1 Tax=Haliotis rufescens TaxID=6454 RepID=UPI001EB0A56D|nr:uncharacterized protein LOC124152541 [Haliotis rufescens]